MIIQCQWEFADGNVPCSMHTDIQLHSGKPSLKYFSIQGLSLEDAASQRAHTKE